MGSSVMRFKVIAICLLCGSAAFGEDTIQTMVGAWRVVTWTDTNEKTGMPYYPFGMNPKGEFLFTADGHFSADVESDPNGALPPALPKPDFDDLQGPFLGYFGTYTFDGADSTVAYEVGGSSAPAYAMSDVSNRVRFDGNRLILSGESVRRNGHRYTWERVLERDPHNFVLQSSSN